ncbi:hypothetical protein CFOL_v3_13227 [Cephalotus follicularis]|uniref:AvrRpt-cleavage domain-containing protein n=1 Tax=Cephalotus follicularis TaxID=3775 RepID=A0A1Q3BNY8_CEPFO|nr:hypothetical protein CFOL_v3_13227 [Cephalotus follicularis]
MDIEWKRSGQIPTFGDWDYANDMPITQYFECARQAGLIRYSSSSGESDPYNHFHGDLYTVDKRHSRDLTPPPPPRKTRVGEKRGHHVKEKKRQGKVCAMTDPPRKQQTHPTFVSQNHKLRDNNVVSLPNSPPHLPARPPKPVDEDLYKIPAELLHSTKRKKTPRFFSCLVTPCAS